MKGCLRTVLLTANYTSVVLIFNRFFFQVPGSFWDDICGFLLTLIHHTHTKSLTYMVVVLTLVFWQGVPKLCIVAVNHSDKPMLPYGLTPYSVQGCSPWQSQKLMCCHWSWCLCKQASKPLVLWSILSWSCSAPLNQARVLILTWRIRLWCSKSRKEIPGLFNYWTNKRYICGCVHATDSKSAWLMFWSLHRCTCALLSAFGSCAVPTEAPSSRWDSIWERLTTCCLKSTPVPSKCCTAKPRRAPDRRLSKLSVRIWARR